MKGSGMAPPSWRAVLRSAALLRPRTSDGTSCYNYTLTENSFLSLLVARCLNYRGVFVGFFCVYNNLAKGRDT